MKAKDLMIGDWVRVNRDGLCIKKDTIVQVRGIDGDDKIEEKGLFGAAHCHPLDEDQFDGGIWLDYLDPIPLTPEILEKNGFERCVSSIVRTSTAAIPVCDSNQFATADFPDLRIIDRGIWHYSLRTPVVCDLKHYEIHEIKYVHELQHALRLCGIEKEISL